MSQMITWGSLPIVYCQLCWSPILANHRAMKCELWEGHTTLSSRRWKIFFLEVILLWRVLSNHFIFTPDPVQNWRVTPLHYLSHPTYPIQHTVSIVLPFPSMYMNTWANYDGWPIKNTHFLGPMEGLLLWLANRKHSFSQPRVSWACLQAKLKGPLLMGSSVQMP